MRNQCLVLHIHGTLNDEDHLVTFGYRDEIDEAFKMEKINNNDYLKHIKSLGYFRTNNYSQSMVI